MQMRIGGGGEGVMGYINNDGAGWKKNMHRTEINETRAWPVASYKIYRDVTLPLQCPWQVTTPFFPTHSATPPKTERQTVGHVIVTDCAKNSGNKAVFLTPPPFSQQWTRTKNNIPPTNTHKPPTHHPLLQRKMGKRSCSCQLSRLLTCTGNLLKLKTTCTASQFASLSVCHPASQSIHQSVS